MIKKISVFVISVICIFNCLLLSAAGNNDAMPPDDIKYVKPSDDIPSKIRSMLGKWEGDWDGALNSIFIFEKVTQTKAYIAYCVGINTRLGFKTRTNSRLIADLSYENDKLSFSINYGGNTSLITGSLSEDGKTIKAKYFYSSIVLKKTGEPDFNSYEERKYLPVKIYPLPEVIGPVPVTEKSYPFNAASKSIRDQKIDEYGYVEEEYFVSGHANVYDLDADDRTVVIKADAPYTTRIIVRRPQTEKKFSGTAVVELLNPTGKYDFDFHWSMSGKYFMRSGDAWIGITGKPITVKALQKFDPERYKSLSWKNPFPPEETCEKPSSYGNLDDTTPENENGLVWDIASQVGALLKSNESENPLAGFSVKNAILTGYSQSGVFTVSYINFIRPLASAKLENGNPVYDGYLIGDGEGDACKLNQCASQFYLMDPRTKLYPSPEPVISVVTQSTAAIGSMNRKTNINTPTDRYRRYEVPGSCHGSQKQLLDLRPRNEDVLKSGSIPGNSEETCKEIKEFGHTDFPFSYFMNGAFANLKNWIRTGTAPVEVPPIEIMQVRNSPYPVEKTDKFGNALGGIRSPYVDVPAATYFKGSTPVKPELAMDCIASGYRKPFTKQQMKELYTDHETYMKKVKASVDDLLEKRLVTQEDADKILEEAKLVSFE